MPWALGDGFVLSGMPNEKSIDKYGWAVPTLGMITLCSKRPLAMMDPRVEWWAHFPLPDGRIWDIPKVMLARDTALSMRSFHNTVVIHCVAGRNRSGLIGALILRELHQLTGPQALEMVRRLRPNSVDNPYFEEYLMGIGAP
jgi:hypothetical protein